MLFDKYITGADKQAFIAKATKVATAIGVKVDWLLAVMYVESRFRAYAVNETTKATGLIQFMPATAVELKTTVAALATMSRVQQLDYVYAYYKPYIGKFTKFTDLYLATFFPLALKNNWPDSAVLETSRLKASTIASQNKIFDVDKNKQITVGEFRKATLMHQPPEAQGLETLKATIPWLLVAGLGVGVYFFTRKTN